MQLDLKHETFGLVDVQTRWHSSYYMVKRANRSTFLLELYKDDLMLSDSKFSTLKAFCEVATGIEKYITISSVRSLKVNTEIIKISKANLYRVSKYPLSIDDVACFAKHSFTGDSAL